MSSVACGRANQALLHPNNTSEAKDPRSGTMQPLPFLYRKSANTGHFAFEVCYSISGLSDSLWNTTGAMHVDACPIAR